MTAIAGKAQKAAFIIHNLSELSKELDKIEDDTAAIERLTISDLRKKVPALVNKSVSAIYNISRNEIARANYKTESKNSGKRHVSTHTAGKTIAELTFYFRGRRRADWPTTAQPMPKQVKSSKVFSNKKKYSVSQEVFRGKKAALHPKNGNRLFIARIGGTLVPMVVGSKNKPLIRTSSSVPSAILNEQVVAIWQPELNVYIRERLEHHARRFSEGAIYPEPTYGD